MSYDGIVMRAVTHELNRILTGARIDKIYQPNKNEIYLVLRQPGHTYRLLLSALAQEPGVFLTTRPFTNPAEPPLFCMLLRKHLEGGKILSFTQQGLERIMEIKCDAADEVGERVERRLIVEIMGKHSNIILFDPARNKILDAIHRVTPVISRYRQVLPGLGYQPPPPQEKTTPWEIDQDAFYRLILSLPLSQTLARAILAKFSGFGPLTAQEVVNRAGLEPSLPLEYCGEYELSRLWQAFSQTAAEINGGNFFPEVIIADKAPLAFSALSLTQYAPEMRHSFPGINEALDFYFSHKKSDNLIKQKKADLAQLIKKETERCEKKAGLQLQAVQESLNSEKYRLWGELLTSYHHFIQPGKEVDVVNFYDPKTTPVKIPLDENLTVIENAQHYFNKYQKAKNAARQASIHYAETVSELEYLNSLLTSLENVTRLDEVEEIREEIKEAGYIKTPSGRMVKRKIATKETSLPHKIVLDSWDIYVGKNNRQNDLLVTKIAKPEDTWLHTKDIPGSHVIIKNPSGQKVPAHILEKAAMLAAYHSKARLSTNVPVDYTLKKHVWKLKGSRPGMVHYENQRTVFVTPSPEAIKTLLDK